MDKDKGWTRLDNATIRDPELSLQAKGLLMIIRSFIWGDDPKFPSNAVLAECAGVSARYVRTLLEELEGRGFLKDRKSHGARELNMSTPEPGFHLNERTPEPGFHPGTIVPPPPEPQFHPPRNYSSTPHIRSPRGELNSIQDLREDTPHMARADALARAREEANAQAARIPLADRARLLAWVERLEFTLAKDAGDHLDAGYTCDQVCEAVLRCVARNKRNPGYLRGVLQGLARDKSPGVSDWRGVRQESLSEAPRGLSGHAGKPPDKLAGYLEKLRKENEAHQAKLAQAQTREAQP